MLWQWTIFFYGCSGFIFSSIIILYSFRRQQQQQQSKKYASYLEGIKSEWKMIPIMFIKKFSDL